jgi:hypothetical protein
LFCFKTNKGYIAEATNSTISAFIYSGVCFLIGTMLSGMISFGELCHLFKKKEDYEVPQNQQEAQ